MGLKDIGATLPPGFRFYPSDEELVCHYLYKKIMNEDILKGTLVEIDLHTCEPWQLPEVAKLNTNEWYFFSFRDRKYATGFRTNRATTSGYWKATGKDRTVVDTGTGDIVGMRKTLVFYRNRAPNGIKTCWIMHEFRLEAPHRPPKEDWVLCRVFQKSKQEQEISNTNSRFSQRFERGPCANMGAMAAAAAASPQLPTDHQSKAMANFGYNVEIASISPTTAYRSQSQNQNQNQNQNQSHGPGTCSLLHLQFPQEKSYNNSKTEVYCPKNESEYGMMLWDMEMEEHTFDTGVSSNLDQIGFDIDSSLIFL